MNDTTDMIQMQRDGCYLYPHIPRKPLAAVQPDGRIAVYVGSAYQYLDLRAAIHMRDQLNQAIDGRLNQTGEATS